MDEPTLLGTWYTVRTGRPARTALVHRHVGQFLGHVEQLQIVWSSTSNRMEPAYIISGNIMRNTSLDPEAYAAKAKHSLFSGVDSSSQRVVVAKDDEILRISGR